MPGTPLNADLAALVTLLGEPNVRVLIGTFLGEYPELLEKLATGDRKTRHRMVHSLKSNAHIIGARELSAKMAAFEQRLLADTVGDLTPDEIAWIRDAFNEAAAPLRAFVDGK